MSVNRLFKEELRQQNIKKAGKRYENNQLKEIYLEDKKSGIYNYLNEIPQSQLFIYFFLMFFSYHVLNRTLDFSPKNLIIFIVSIILIYLYNERRRSVNITKMQELELKLESIYPTPKYFYIDAGIIEIVYSIKDLENFNKPSYEKAVRILDKFLKLILEIEIHPNNCHQYLDLLETKKKEVLNLIQSIVHKMPTDKVVEDKLTDAMESLHYILNFHTENVKQICNKKIKDDGWNTESRPTYSNKIAIGSDPMFNGNFDFY